MPITKNVTRWYPSGGKGYVTSTTGNLLTQSGVDILTQSGVALTLNPNAYKPKSITTWVKTLKEVTAWRPLRGVGYVVSQGTLNITDNLGNLFVDNLGNDIVTTPTYVTAKNTTVWKASGS